MRSAVSSTSVLTTLRVPVGNGFSLFIFHAANGDHDDVDEPTDTEDPAGQKPKDSGPDLAEIKTVDTQSPEKDSKQKCDQSWFRRLHVFPPTL